MVDIKVEIDAKQVKRMLKRMNGLMPQMVVKPLSAAAQMVAGIAIKDYTRGPRPERLGRRTGRLDARRFGDVWQVNRESLQKYLKEAKDSDDKRWGPKE